MVDRRTVANAAAEKGGQVAMEYFGTELAAREKTGAVDVVTEADEAAQEAVVEVIREAYPDDLIVGEEGDAPKRVPDSGPAWIVDPIDGTTNFVHGLRRWGTAVAFVCDRTAVTSALTMPALEEQYVADGTDVRLNDEPISVSDRDDPDSFVVAPILRYTDDREAFAALLARIIHEFDQFERVGSAQSTLALVARGSLDAAVGLGVADPWDTVAGATMIRRAGGTVTDLNGEPWRPDSEGIVATSGTAHQAVVDRLAGSVLPAANAQDLHNKNHDTP